MIPRHDRLAAMALNGARQFVPPLGQLVLAWLVVQRAGDGAWGTVVGPLVVASVLSQLLAWGSKDLLIRAFAHQPGAVATMWYGNLMARAVGLTPAVLAMVVVSTGAAEWGWWSVWLVARFVAVSFEPLVLGDRRLGPAMIAEILAVLVATAVVVVAPAPLTIEWTVAALAVGAVIRTAVLVAVFARRLGSPIGIAPDLRSLATAVPFVLTGLAGTLASKADLWLVAAFQSAALVGRYHVISNALLALQATTAMAMAPFARGLYRLPDDALRRLSWRLLGLGLPVSALGVGAVMLIMRSAFGFHLGWSWFVVGAVFVLPMFATAPRIHLLLKQNRESSVAVVAFAAGLLNAVLTWLALPRFGLLGALAASAAAQWAQVVVVVWMTRSAGILPQNTGAGDGDDEPIDYLEHLALWGAASIHAGGRRGSSALLDRVTLGPRSRVLEFGCGSGETLVRIGAAGGTAVGVDRSLATLVVAGSRRRWCGVAGGGGLVASEGIPALPFRDRSFDLVVVESVLAIQPGDVLRPLLAELHRVTVPGGRMLVNETVWADHVPRTEADRVNRSVEQACGLIQARLEPFGVDDWRHWFEAAGFEVESTESIDGITGDPHASAKAGVVLRSRVMTAWRRWRQWRTAVGRARRRRVVRAVRALSIREGMLHGVLFSLRRSAISDPGSPGREGHRSRRW